MISARRIDITQITANPEVIGMRRDPCQFSQGRRQRGFVTGLKQAGDFHVGQTGDSAGEILHLIREFFVDAPRRFVDRRAH